MVGIADFLQQAIIIRLAQMPPSEGNLSHSQAGWRTQPPGSNGSSHKAPDMNEAWEKGSTIAVSEHAGTKCIVYCARPKHAIWLLVFFICTQKWRITHCLKLSRIKARKLSRYVLRSCFNLVWLSRCQVAWGRSWYSLLGYCWHVLP
jgi:hypothetical protein